MDIGDATCFRLTDEDVENLRKLSDYLDCSMSELVRESLDHLRRFRRGTTATSTISVRLTPDQRSELKTLSDQHDVTQSRLVRFALRRLFEDYEKKLRLSLDKIEESEEDSLDRHS